MENEVGLAFLYGHRHGQQAAEQDFETERQRLRKALADASSDVSGHIALKRSAMSVINAAVVELQQKASGVPVNIRHSDPLQGRAHVEDFLDTAEGNLRRISDGTLTFGPAVETHKKAPNNLRSVSSVIKPVPVRK